MRGCAALVNDVNIGTRDRVDAAALAQKIDHTLDTHRETATGRRLASHAFEKRVIPATAADRPLAAERIGDPLENREVVVVEAAHQARVDGEFDARRSY